MAAKDRKTRKIPAETVRLSGGRRERPAGTDAVSEPPAAETSDQRAQEIRAQLAGHVDALRFTNGALMVCVQALLQQAAEMDEEIAHVLQRTVGDKLDATTDRIEAIALGIEDEEA